MTERNVSANLPTARFDPARVPASLRERPQSVCWKFITRRGKPTKCPVSPRERGRANPTDPSTWTSFDEAVAAWRSDGFSGVGYVFAADDPYSGIDLDDCIDGTARSLRVAAQRGAVASRSRAAFRRVGVTP